MKLKLGIALFLTFAILAGCNDNNNDNAMDDGEQLLEEMNPEKDSTPANPAQDKKLGYVRYTKDQIERSNEEDHAVRIDRTKLANMITRMILRSDGFNEVATLVTDEKVLIAYDKDNEMDANRAAEIAKKPAMSVLPRFYAIHVSDNETLMEDIQSLHNSNVQRDDYDNTINQIIREMKKSPQGDTKTNNNMAK